jgi:hypothetical protein
MEHVNTPCLQNPEHFNIEVGGTYTYRCALKALE